MRILIILLISLSLLTACGPTKESNQQVQVDPEENVRSLMQSGDFSAAALEYINLGEKDKKKTAIYRLKATAAYIEAEDYSEAQKTLSTTTVLKSDSLQYIRMKILGARLQLEFSQPVQALALLDEVTEAEIPQNLKVSYHDIRAKAYLAHGDYLKAVSERIQLSNYLDTPVQKESNNRALWAILESMPESDIDDLRINAPEELRSWFELASLYRTYRYQPVRLSSAIDGWVQRNPGHPAYSSIAPELIAESKQFVNRPQKIGLLLPLSGKYEKSSTAIRDGFIAAWYMDNQDNSEIEIYDANAMNIVDVYQQAVTEGVDYVVGPLEKEAINQLVNLSDLPVQILALNRQDLNTEQTSNKLIQFGLSPEDEAMQVAETAMSDGHRLALVMSPDNPWGERVAEAFMTRWVELGGAVLERSIFESNSKDYGLTVKSLLNIDSSETRARNLRNKLNIKINSVERRREDADFIFTAAVPNDARQLFPQIRFYRAADLPVYATSHIFSGIIDETRDNDLNGVIFLDMPWILETSHQLSMIQDALNRNWSQEKSQYRRLYALGIDAYHLIPQIGRLSVEKNTFLSGETGDLSITPENIVKRKLRRAQFVEGKPVLLN
jgi:outer membrane PBP1 activator LpoA protein